jgi:hypothetical protein
MAGVLPMPRRPPFASAYLSWKPIRIRKQFGTGVVPRTERA